MLTLFPQYRIGAGVGIVLSAFLAGLMIQSGAAWYWPVLTVLLCCFASLGLAELGAAGQHQRLLMILYQKGDPKGFIAAYEPLLKQPVTAPARLLTVHAYLSNAYLAIGDTETALRLLDEAPEVTGRETANARALLAGNRCSIYLQAGDAVRAREQLVQLQSMADDPGINPDLLADLPLLEARCSTLEGEPCGEALLQAAADKAVSSIRKSDLQLALVRVWLAQQHTVKARKLLRQIAQGNHELWAVREAQALLDQLSDSN